MRSPSCLVSCLVPLGGALAAMAMAASAGAQEEKPAEIVAAQVRTHGFRCDAVLGAERVSAIANEAEWILRCSNATYRVRLTPNMGARVQPIR